VADLPEPPKKPRNPVLPVHPQTLVDDFEFEIAIEDSNDFEAAGGVA
jgi:hypothetical protein